jgi:hypothetical protein
MSALETIVIGAIATVVLGTVVVPLVGLRIARYVVEGILGSKHEELNKLNEQITTVKGQHEQARHEIATLVALELDPEMLTNVSQEARLVLAASKRALLAQAEADQTTLEAQLSNARREFDQAIDQIDRENVQKKCIYFQELLDAQVDRVEALSVDVQVICGAISMG